MAFEKKFFLPDAPFLLVASDEAGRGPLAGPVMAGAVAMRVDCPEAAAKELRRLRRRGVHDSKRLSAEERREVLRSLGWQDVLPAGEPHVWGNGLRVAWSRVEPEQIDQLNILNASLLAMRAAAEAVAEAQNLPVVWLIDGNRVPKEGREEWARHPVVDGDAKSVLIGLASLIAKVTRDRVMREYHELYPQYGFGQHVGYGTPQHLAALAEHGPCPWHRKSFAPVQAHFTGA